MGINKLLAKSLWLLIAVVIFLFASTGTVMATEPKLLYTHGEFMDNESIYPTEWIGIIFSEPLKNDSGQATKAIQKAANKAFGSGKTTVETDDNTSFVINVKKKIKLNTQTIILPERSLNDAKSRTPNFSSISIPIEKGDFGQVSDSTSQNNNGDNSAPIAPTTTATLVSDNNTTETVSATAPASTDAYPGQLFFGGTAGEYVKQIQTKLKEKGYDTGALDGIFGRNTTKAVKQFQNNKSLDVDGIVGPITWPALFSLSIIYTKRKTHL